MRAYGLPSMSLLMLGLAAFGSAQLVPVREVPQELRATAVAKIGPDFKLKSPWIQLQESQSPAQVMLINGYDGTNVDPMTMPGGPAFQDFYGPCSTTFAGLGFSWTYGPLANWPLSLNDINVNPAANRKSAQIFRALHRWNPDGTNPAAGTAVCLVAVFTGHGFNPLYDIMDGYLIQFGPATGIAGGYYRLTADFTNTNLSFPLPDTSGFVWVTVGTVDGANNFVQLPAPGTASPGFHNVVDNLDPQWPGTNPSSSTDLAYIDNDGNFILDLATELFTFDQTTAGNGWWSPATAFFVDLDKPTVSGTVTLEDLDPGTLRPVKNINIVVTEAGNPGMVVKADNVALGPNGEYEITAPLAPGNYDIYAASTHWLVRANFNVNYAGVSLSGVNFSLENGDCDMDNEVGIGDFAILSAAFGSDPSAPNWDAMADLNHDDEVNIGDFAIQSGNFGLIGD